MIFIFYYYMMVKELEKILAQKTVVFTVLVKWECLSQVTVPNHKLAIWLIMSCYFSLACKI